VPVHKFYAAAASLTRVMERLPFGVVSAADH
jgi:hypothetical protein